MSNIIICLIITTALVLDPIQASTPNCRLILDAVIAEKIQKYTWKSELEDLNSKFDKADSLSIMRDDTEVIIHTISKYQMSKMHGTLDTFSQGLETPLWSLTKLSFWSKVANFFYHDINIPFNSFGIVIRLWAPDSTPVDDELKLISWAMRSVPASVASISYVIISSTSGTLSYTDMVLAPLAGAIAAFAGIPQVVAAPIGRISKNKRLKTERELYEHYIQSSIDLAKKNGQTGPIRLLIVSDDLNKEMLAGILDKGPDINSLNN